MQTEALKFYHGTNAEAARAVLVAGSKNLLLEEIGAFALGRKIYEAFLAREGLTSDNDLKLYALKGPGSGYSELWVPAFRGLASDRKSHFDYGHFFATLNITNAFRYARNPFGSEFIRAIHESLRLLEHFGHPLPQQVPIDYPDVARRLKTPSNPVALELTGICIERLLRAHDGSPDVAPVIETYRQMEQNPELSFPVDFRIGWVRPEDVAAVYDLCDWPLEELDSVARLHRDDPNVAAVRCSVQDWLTR